MTPEEEARLQVAAAAQQQQFASMMESAIRSSLAGVEAANEALARERKAVEQELDAARAARRQAEQQGEKIAEEFFAKSRAALVEFHRQDLLRTLVHTHLKQGRRAEEICDWLQVEPAFVQRMIDLMDRRVGYLREQAAKGRLRLPGHPRLRYEGAGRGGAIVFENDVTTFEMWWEFGGGNALFLIDIPTPRQWESRTRLPLDQRPSTLQFIAEQVVEDQAPLHPYEIGDAVITILR